ncbi:MAG TPA: hypothetical protein VN231_05195 [Allosphingosinicella sp.]|nr:hypothetical protein [Allosphingosinicella sp.]
MKGSIAILVVGILAVILLVAILKVAVKLALIGVVVVVGLAAFAAMKDGIGGPRA